MKQMIKLNKNREDIKIAFLTTISQTMEWFNLDRVKYLKERGFTNISLICNMDKKFFDSNIDLAALFPLDIERGIRPINFFKSIKSLTKIFKNEHFDVLYYLTPNISYCASLAGKRNKIPYRIYGQCGIRYVSETGIKRAIFKYIEKTTCKNSTTVRSQSPLNMEFAINEGLVTLNKVGVVGIGGTTGVDLDMCDGINCEETRKYLRNKYGISLDAWVYGYVGRLNKDKGCNELIEAFKSVLDFHSNSYLIHLGMIDNCNPVEKENYEFYKNSINIIRVGNVQQKEVYEHMAAMDILVHPTYREGFGKVLQEAMGMRLPIITTNTIGPKEVVEDGVSGILVPIKDANALKEKMIEMFEDESLRMSLSINGRARAEQYFDRKIMLENFFKDFTECIGVKND